LKSTALFATCLVDQFFPEIGLAAFRLLQKGGSQPDFPPDQTCCGQPFFNSGFHTEAIKLAKRTIEIFERYDLVVLPSGSCTTMLRADYPHLLRQEPGWHARALALAEKTRELTEHLEGYPGDPAPRFDSQGSSLTVHDSCHMCRKLGLKEPQRSLAAQADASFREMQEPDRCCGFGGIFSITMPEVSNAMTREKLNQAVQTGADVLVTADPGCLMQMRGLVHELQNAPRIEHIAVLLEEWLE
jgi:L-lactate dehydrogenase complex protein LldE